MVVLEKLTSKYTVPNPMLLNFLIPFFVLIFTIPLALANHVGIPHQWGNLILAAFFGNLFGIMYYLALYKLDVTVIGPLLNLRGIFGVLLGIIFLGEVLNLHQIILIAMILIAGVFVSMDEKFKFSSFLNPAVTIIIFGSFALALNGFFINRASKLTTYWELVMWQAIISQIMLLVTVPFFIKDLKKLNWKQIVVTSLIAVVFVGYNLAANKAYSSNVGISSIIISLPASMVIAFILSLVTPKLLEKHTLKVYFIRFIATGVMVFSALGL